MSLTGAVDLKFRLTLHVAALAALCLLAGFGYSLYDENDLAGARAAAIADVVGRALEEQLEQAGWLKTALNPFPDLQPLAAALQAPGLCIAYRSSAGDVVQRLCSGPQEGEPAAPDWFAMPFRFLFQPGRDVARAITFKGHPHGAAVVALDAETRVDESWRVASRMLRVMAATLTTLCLLVYAALACALRPTRAICAGLKRLAANDLSVRLPAFDLAELTEIRTVFNALAEKLERTLGERTELTRKLVAVQDEERSHLARELHDEFGQSLAAIGALAASVAQTAGRDCPALLPECDGISRAAAHMRTALREALIRLRPPDIEEFGLAMSLESLVASWNNLGRGRTRFLIDIRGTYDALPPTVGANIYRIAQEALTNATKHAQATEVGLRLRLIAVGDACEKQIELTVEDDGAASTTTIAQKSGLGLLGMQERIAALGGRLKFEQRTPKGLILQATLPTPAVAKGRR